MSRLFALFLRIISPLLSVWITYLVIANLALSTHALELFLDHLKPDRIHLTWKSAYTVIPFRVHASQFALRGQDDKLQWFITLDRASVTFAPTDFFQKRIHMKHGAARGVSVRIRSRLEPAKMHRDFVAKLPAIPGYADPPLAGPKATPKPGHVSWSVQLDDVIGDDVREVWVDDVHFIDECGHVEGGFGIRSHRISMRPTKYVAGDMHVLVGDDTLASRAHGVFAVSIDDLDPKALRGVTKLRKVDARAKIRAHVGDLKALSYLIRASHLEVHGGEGVLAVDGELDHGVIAPHIRAELRVGSWRASARRDAMSAAASTIFVRASSAAVFRGAMQTYGYVLRRDGAIVARSNAVGFAYESHDLDITKPPVRWGASIDVPTSSVPDLASLNGYTSSQFLPHGTATFRGHADFSPHVARVKFELANVDAEAERGWWTSGVLSPMRFDGDVTTFTVSGTSRDARLPLEILGTPDIARALFGHQSFAFDARLRIAPHVFELERAHAAGDKLEVLARYEKRRNQKRGAVLVVAPVMNVGLGIRDGKTAIRPFASRQWFESQ
jgi:hypothetical protein